MIRCASCKKKGSSEQCQNSSLPGIVFCGIHAKSKTPILWKTVNHVDEKCSKILNIWRGYIIRKQLKAAGSGVLKRSLCHNQEEIVSMEPISTIPPFDYFGFEENGKVYGFDIRTIIDTMHRNRTPANPYTRQPLSLEVRKRLRYLYGLRMRQKMEVQYEHNHIRGMDAILTSRWSQVCQILEENGFPEINPNTFLALNKTQLYVFLKFMHADISSWASEHAGKESVRIKHISWVAHIIKRVSASQNHSEIMALVTGLLRALLYDCSEQYTICFFIMSALYRL